MRRDITYCVNDDCPFTDCIRHARNLTGENPSTILSFANFGGTCRRYIEYLVGDLDLQYDDELYAVDE